jgi:MFS family permease
MTARARPSAAPPRLGIRANLPQFALLVAINALVGAMVGQERTVLPLIASDIFGLNSVTVMLTFLVAFGAVKAVANVVAGVLADRVGRRPVLLAGWLAAIPVPLLLMWAPSWGWVVLANVFLGVNQGFAWSATVIMKIDLVGPSRRGMAMGMNEAAGYAAVAVTALVTGYVAARAGLRPEPFLIGIALACAGLGLSLAFARETRGHADHEAGAPPAGSPSTGAIFVRTSFRDRASSAACQAGLVNNLNDALAWGILPLLFARGGLPVATIGVLVALYPGVWGLGQLVTGALSDHIGRKHLISSGMFTQAAALIVIASGSTPPVWACGSVLLGIGTAMVYPTLLSAVSDVAHPTWRASSIGVYRLWRDLGFAVGGLFTGIVADAYGLRAAIWAGGALTAISGAIVHVRMYETLGRRGAA